VTATNISTPDGDPEKHPSVDRESLLELGRVK
jgi:hypothetical protein